MSFPLQITFGNTPPSRILENRIQELARRLERFSAHIAQCHVAIRRLPQSASQGATFEVHVNVSVPSCIIAICRTWGDRSPEEPYVALRDAFNAAKRKLRDYETQTRNAAQGLRTEDAHSATNRSSAGR